MTEYSSTAESIYKIPFEVLNYQKTKIKKKTSVLVERLVDCKKQWIVYSAEKTHGLTASYPQLKKPAVLNIESTTNKWQMRKKK